MQRIRRWYAVAIAVGAVVLVLLFFGFELLKDRRKHVLEGFRQTAEQFLEDAERARRSRYDVLPETTVNEPLPSQESLEQAYATLAHRINSRFSLHEIHLFEQVSKRRHLTEWPEGTEARFVALVDRNADLAAQARELAHYGGPIVHIDHTQPFPKSLNHYAARGPIAEFLRGDTLVAAARGDQERALDDLMALMRIGDAFAAEDSHAGWRGMKECYRLAFDAISVDLPAGFFEADQVETLLAHIDESFQRDTFVAWMAGVALRQCTEYEGPTKNPLRATNALAYAEFTGQSMELCKEPHCKTAGELQRLESAVFELSSLYDDVKRRMLPYWSHSQSQAVDETRRDLVRLGLRVEEYYRKHGKYPESLNVLAPHFGGQVPLDPISGNPFRYEAKDGKFLLYGVGVNVYDDGGIPDFTDGDLVWRPTSD